MVTTAYFQFIVPVVAVLNTDIVGVDNSILGSDVILTVGVSRIRYCIDIVAHPSQGNPLVVVEKIDVCSELIVVVAPYPTCGPAKLGSLCTLFGDDVDGTSFIDRKSVV